MSGSGRRPRTPALLALLLLLVACGAPTSEPVDDRAAVNAPEHRNAPHVVMVSFDGFSSSLMDIHPAPNFERMARDGVRAERLIPAFPTKTFPAHYTIATGMHAENHGLVGNRFWAPELGAYYSTTDRTVVEDARFYRGEPIWVTAEKQGMVSASFFFVGSEAPVGGHHPTYWRRFDPSIPHVERVDQVLEWLAMPEETRPHMVTLYFEDVDTRAHTYGYESPETAAAVAKVDASLGRLLDGIDALPHGDEVYVVLVSDHGLGSAPATSVDELDMSLFPGVRLITHGPYASIVIDEGPEGRAVAVRDSMAALLPEDDVWLRRDVPERLHYSSDPRIGDIVIVAAPGRTVRPAGWNARNTFEHGWDNHLPEMGAILLIRGPEIAGGQRIGPVESIHVYPLLAHLLGLEANPDIDGDLSVLWPILER